MQYNFETNKLKTARLVKKQIDDNIINLQNDRSFVKFYWADPAAKHHAVDERLTIQHPAVNVSHTALERRNISGSSESFHVHLLSRQDQLNYRITNNSHPDFMKKLKYLQLFTLYRV